MKYKGSCHCGRIAIEVEGDMTELTDCNCSICSRKGALMWFVPKDKMTLLTPPEYVETYLFNTKTIKHKFCPKCGIHVFGEAKAPDGKEMVAINARCLENVDLSAYPVKHFDGKSL